MKTKALLTIFSKGRAPPRSLVMITHQLKHKNKKENLPCLQNATRAG